MAEKSSSMTEDVLGPVFNIARYSVIAAIFSSIAGQLLMLYVGSTKVFRAIQIYLTEFPLQELGLPEHLTHADVAIALVIESIDAFLIALVLFYFAFGIYRLFLVPATAKKERIMPIDFAPSSLGDLKEILAQLVVVVLFILFTRTIWLSLNNLEWNILVLPISIALLALSIKLARFK